MDRILIIGGGVGGTLTANLLARRLKKRIDRREAQVTVVDATGAHVYQPGFMYIAMGGERAEKLQKRERALLDSRVNLVVGTVHRVDEGARTATLTDGTVLPYDQLVLATGARILPEAIEGFESEAHHFYTAAAALRLRKALDAFTGGKIVIGIASMPYKCPPAPLEVAFLVESELRERGLRERSEIHFASPIGRAFTIESVSEMATPILEQKGIELHTFFNVETIDAERKVVGSLEGEELPYDLLILVPPHKGQQFLMDSGLAPAPGGWLPTDRHTLLVGGRPPARGDLHQVEAGFSVAPQLGRHLVGLTAVAVVAAAHRSWDAVRVPPEEPVDRLAGSFPSKIPEADVDQADGPQGGASAWTRDAHLESLLPAGALR